MVIGWLDICMKNFDKCRRQLATDTSRSRELLSSAVIYASLFVMMNSRECKRYKKAGLYPDVQCICNEPRKLKVVLCIAGAV